MKKIPNQSTHVTPKTLNFENVTHQEVTWKMEKFITDGFETYLV